MVWGAMSVTLQCVDIACNAGLFLLFVKLTIYIFTICDGDSDKI